MEPNEPRAVPHNPEIIATVLASALFATSHTVPYNADKANDPRITTTINGIWHLISLSSPEKT
jgi:hypothetical protein